MSDEITVSNTSYISSKRASELSGYTQDYIGQLARGGYIDAQRIGGLWYVSMDSLTAYKEKSEAEKSESPRYVKQTQDPATLVLFDGKQFISAGRAAEITGYNQDYVGQLARSSQILSRQVGNRWYVDQEAILKHKKEKDALLAAVQVESVGLYRGDRTTEISRVATIDSGSKKEAYFTYSSETADLMPVFARGNEDAEQGIQDESEEVHAIPIRRLADMNAAIVSEQNTEEREIRSYSGNTRSTSGAPRRAVLFFGLAVCVVATLSVGLIFFQGKQPYTKTFSENEGSGAGESFVATVGAMGDRIGSMLEDWLVPEMIYHRLQD